MNRFVAVSLVTPACAVATPAVQADEGNLAEVVTPSPAAAARKCAPLASPIRWLPATASKLPFFGLLGLMALADAFAVRATAIRLS